MYKEQFTEYIHQLQNEICTAIEQVDTKAKFQEDLWKRPGGGGGRSRVIEKGSVFEKGGVSISEVFGELPAELKKNMKVEGSSFFACGLSLVIHPENPFVPTVHANYRFFEMYNKKGLAIDRWFGGGTDLTPYYLFKEDAIHFHANQKQAASIHGKDLYPKFKEKCDQYFFNHHRGEARGIGGTFYDYLRPDEKRSTEDWLKFNMTMGKSFLPGYIPIVEKRKDLPYTDKHRYWQEIRRGRYVEFNLVHDRGTLFGLKTNGRTESILMSLPPRVRWDYNHHPAKGSPEAQLIEVLQKPIDWV